MTTNFRIYQNWQALRLTYGLVAFLAGLNKFFHLLAHSEAHLAPQVAALLPVSGRRRLDAGASHREPAARELARDGAGSRAEA